MQIFIDGYNLLFRLQSFFSDVDFSKARMHLIEELERHAAECDLCMTCVFDASFRDDDLCQSHYYSLKIVFTPKGMSADDYLLETFKQSQNPRSLKLVTSDLILAKKARAYGVQAEKAEEFLIRLRRKAQKKHFTPIRVEQKTVKEKKVHKELIKIFEEKAEVPKKRKRNTELPSLANIDAWVKIFEERSLEE